MPTQTNYKQDVMSVGKRDPVLRLTTDIGAPIILDINSAFFAYSLEDYVEMHLYKPTTGELVSSAIIPVNSGLISARVYSTNQEPNTQAIVFEMKEITYRYFSRVKPGTYDLTINFFSHMVGNDIDRMMVDKISPSRTEIVVKFPSNPTVEQRTQIREFVQPSVNKQVAQGIIEQLFNTKNILDNTATPTETLTRDDIAGFLNTLNTGARLQHINQLEHLLSLMPELLYKINRRTLDNFISNTTDGIRIQQNELNLYILNAILEEVHTFADEGHFDERVRVT